MLKRILKSLIISIIYNSLFAGGNLDTSFGTNGIVISQIGAESEAKAVTTAQNGKIIAVGRAWLEQIEHDRCVIARYNLNGSLDLAFGTNGRVIFDINNQDSVLSNVKIDTNSNIVIAGNLNEEEQTVGFISRVLSNGAIDTSFGQNGIVKLDSLGITEYSQIESIDVQNNGKIIAIGYEENEDQEKDTIILRFNINGSLDNSFGANGIIRPPFQGSQSLGLKIIIQPDNKILALMRIDQGYSLARYNSDGTLDTTFGNLGIVTGNQYMNYMNLQTDGKIVLAGRLQNSFVLNRLNNNGTNDASFTNGLSSVPYLESRSMGMILQNDEKIITKFNYEFGPTWKYKLIRFNQNGVLDTSFGNNGIVDSEIGKSRFIYDLAITQDGKLIICGTSSLPGIEYDHFMLGRYKTSAEQEVVETYEQQYKYLPYGKRPSEGKEKEEIEATLKKVKRE
ncbi:hypothetical protein M1446_04290 [Candidatus Dependentiae bacterium]|nr:hypothetical protein [Candidatus Dependentiae bacterium]